MEEKHVDVIDLRLILKRIKQNKWKFIIILPIVFGLSCAYTLCLPRFYQTEVKLVPEMGGSNGIGNTLGSIASSFGLDFGEMETTDAITPLLYPDLMEDNAFVASLYDIKVQSNFDQEMPIDTTYYAYLRYFQKTPPWTVWMYQLKQRFNKTKPFQGATGEYDPYFVSKKEDDIMSLMRSNIAMDLDKKTGVISISVKAQDPIICRTVADSLKNRLQDFIIDYRTKKVRLDAEHYKELTEEAKAEYDSIRFKYAKVVDENQDVVLKTVSTEIEEMENEMQLHYNTYTAMQAQYQTAKAKVQERTPVFTLLKGANVPVKHAGPKRMLIVAGICFLATFVLVVYSMRKEILK